MFIAGCRLRVTLFAFRLVGFNDAFEPFLYSVFTSFVLMLLMEAITLSVVEGLKNAMLSVTFAMILLGMMFLFAGYFIKVQLPVLGNLNPLLCCANKGCSRWTIWQLLSPGFHGLSQASMPWKVHCKWSCCECCICRVPNSSLL